MGKLAERLAKVPEPKLCRVGRIEAEMDAEDFAAWKQAVKKVQTVNPKDRSRGSSPYTFRWLFDSLRAEGIVVDLNAISPHLNGTCICDSAMNHPNPKGIRS